MIATQLNIDVRRVGEIIRRYREETRVLQELAHQFPADLVNLRAVNARDSESILALLLAGDSGADFQNRKRSQEREHTRNRVELTHHLGSHLLNRLALLRWLDKSKSDSLVRRQKAGCARHGEVGDDVRVLVQSLVHAIL